jgi:putative FmdB family regulatory protein
MPIYDYRCSDCDEVFQAERELGSMDELDCPLCGSVSRRVFTIFETPPSIGGGACASGSKTAGSIAGCGCA